MSARVNLVRNDRRAIRDHQRHRRNHDHHVDVELTAHQRVRDENRRDPAQIKTIRAAQRRDREKKPRKKSSGKVQDVKPRRRVVHPRRHRPPDRLLDDHLVRVRRPAHQHRGREPQKRNDDHRGDRRDVIDARKSFLPPRLEKKQHDSDHRRHRSFDQRGNSECDGGRKQSFLTQHPHAEDDQRREADVHPSRLRRSPHHQRGRADERRQRAAHPPHQPDQEKERDQRRQHERPHRIDAEGERQEVDHPEMHRRFVRERNAIESRQKKRAAGAHFAYHLCVFRLVADEKLALKGRDPGGEDGDGERGLQRARRQGQLFDYTPLRSVEKYCGGGCRIAGMDL